MGIGGGPGESWGSGGSDRRGGKRSGEGEGLVVRPLIRIRGGWG